MTLWIDRKTFLVRRIDEKRQWKFEKIDFQMEGTTTYDPVINANIPDNLLLFDPPPHR